MTNNDYTLLPFESPLQHDVELEARSGTKPGPHRRDSGPTTLQANDPRFNPPTPSPLKRAALLFFVFCLFWFALRLRTVNPSQSPPAPEPERFFPDFDYRPAVNDERIKNPKMRFTERTAH
ncbi:hypothetical protein BJ322DRAFT_1103942 [Thelephora terrestris]|uniref:Uncharacterized protein n=1 Tax=Thelephora terrestris TaxID=56493 RepID=A0A9P6HLH1_9AGAM|nr:hypothetical protein BJ322DRAFT_1103942 [Thelephora terrestris]